MTLKASNYPTVRPSLDLNFAQTKRLDPRVTFSRNSSATYFDSDGLLKSAATNVPRFDHNPTTGESLGLLVEEARTNSLVYSERYSVSSWTKINVTVRDNAALAPDGTFTAVSLTETAGTATYHIYQTGSVTASTTHTFGVFAKGDGSGRLLNLTLQTDAGYLQSYFNLSTGTVSNVSAGLTASIQAVNNGWYRCLVTATTGNTNCTPFIYIAAAAGENSVYVNRTGNGVSGILVWGAMRELGSFPTSYIPTPATFTSRASSATYYDANGVIQTASTNVARSNAFFPDANGVMRPAGLLLEAAGTNLVTYSEQFDNAAWTKHGGSPRTSITTNTHVAPDGTTTADTLEDGVTDNYGEMSLATGVSASANTDYTASIYVRKDATTTRFPEFMLYDATNGIYAQFRLNTSTGETYASGTLGSPVYRIYCQSIGSYWRIGIGMKTGASPVTNLNFYVRPAVSSSLSGSFSNTVTGSIVIWGAQLEASPYPTSYIATTASTVTRSADVSSSATVTRSADVAQITGTNFSSWYRQDEGTLVCQYDKEPANGTALIFGLTGTTDNDRLIHYFRASGTQLRFDTQIGAANESVITITNTNPSFYKVAFGIKAQNIKATLNGSIPVQDTSRTQNLPTVNRLLIGTTTVTGTYLGIGHVSRLTYWPTRLSDATLQAITR